jgi:hypothetical protein
LRRVFVLEFLSNASILRVHASRLAEDWIIYSTEEFGFLELSGKVTTGSSLIPQEEPLPVSKRVILTRIRRPVFWRRHSCSHIF